MSNKPKHPPRMQAVIELGPFTGSPYANWGVYELSPNAFEDQEVFAQELEEIDSVLVGVDTGDSPYGPFTAQMRRFLNDAQQRIEDGEAGPLRTSMTLPYDGDLRTRREADEYAEYNAVTTEPLDFELVVIVQRVEEDQ